MSQPDVPVVITVPRTTGSSTSIGGDATEVMARRRKVYIKNIGTTNVLYVGGSGVTTGSGYPIRVKEELWLDVTPGAAIYGIMSSAAMSANVRVLEAGV